MTGVPLRVLIVEDSEDDAQLILRTLQTAGYDVNSGVIASPEGLRSSLEQPWDVVLCDHNLPGFNSSAALRIVQAAVPRLPFILVSGALFDEQAIDLIHEGAADYVLKASLSRLPFAVGGALEQKREKEQRDRTVEELRSSERLLARAQTIARLGNFELDLATGEMYWSEELHRLLGQRSSDSPNLKALLAAIDTADQLPVEEAMQACVSSHEPFLIRTRALRDDGTLIDVEIRGRVNRTGSDASVLGTVQDVTDQTRAERAQAELTQDLRTSEERYRSIVEMASEGVCVVDSEGRAILANPGLATMLGCSQEEIDGEQISTFLSPEARPLLVDAMDRSIRGSSTQLELTLRRKDGGAVVALTSTTTISYGDSSVGILLMLADITERKNMAAQSEKMKSEFFALVSHELRTPLTSIMGYIELLVEGEAESLSPSGVKFLTVINRNAERLDRLIQDLLLIPQIEAEAFEVQLEDVQIAELIESCREECAAQAIISDVELRVKVESIPAFPGDPVRLNQVLGNLVSNALKFTNAGGCVNVTARKDGDRCLVEVTDDGLGIDPADLEHLFDRFYRATRTRHDQVQGAGLGLAISKAIVEQHGGTLEVHSKLGEGSVFRMTLPLTSTATAGAGEEEKALATAPA
jgi:PAS domain S-box-containing protein